MRSCSTCADRQAASNRYKIILHGAQYTKEQSHYVALLIRLMVELHSGQIRTMSELHIGKINVMFIPL